MRININITVFSKARVCVFYATTTVLKIPNCATNRILSYAIRNKEKETVAKRATIELATKK